MENLGWVKLHRKFLDWEWHGNPNVVTLFIHLLLLANFEDKNWQGKIIKRGSIITGRKILAKSIGVSEQSIRSALISLKSTNEVTIQPTNRFSIITICNYDSYQNNITDINQLINQPSNQQATNKQPTSNQQATTTKEYKNDKNEKKERKKDIGDSGSVSISVIKEVVEYLNVKTKRKYLPTSKDCKLHIPARFKEGYSLEDFKQVIDNQCSEWLNNTKMNKYLCPETLFGNKFDKYLNSKPIDLYEQLRNEYKEEYISFNKYKWSKDEYEISPNIRKTTLEIYADVIKLILEQGKSFPNILRKGKLTARQFYNLLYLFKIDSTHYNFNPYKEFFPMFFNNQLWRYGDSIMESIISYLIKDENRADGYNGRFSNISKDEILKLI